MAGKAERVVQKKGIMTVSRDGRTEVREVDYTLTLYPKNARASSPADVAAMQDRQSERIAALRAQVVTDAKGRPPSKHRRPRKSA